MKDETRKFAEGKVQALLASDSCCNELKEAAGAWLKAKGTAEERTATEALLRELEEDVVPLTDTLAFFRSEDAVKYFGKDKAAALTAEAEKALAAGEKYCICDACQAGAALLKAKNALLS